MSDNNNGEKRLPPHITEDDIRLLSGIIGPVFYEQGFNAAWAVDAEGIAQLREALDTALRVEGAWRDRCIEAEAERDALAHQIAAVEVVIAEALAEPYWEDMERILAAYSSPPPVTPESHVMALPPESAGRIAADVKATFWPSPVTPESETNP